ncbi:MAG: leucine-rich repeat domain-containing protein [Lachnospiraceae bacterium]|nr:leucine-rich repeat domain-containing protein [Lachnospiraceae bacterium]
MKKYRKILNIIMALILAASVLPGGDIVSYADEITDGITEDVEEEFEEDAEEEFTEEIAEDVEAEFTEDVPEELPDVIPDETAPDDEEGFGEALFYVEIKYYRPYKTATYELEYYEDNGHLVICGYRGVAGGEPVIPARINDVPVTIISESAFKDCSGFTGKLVIPEGVVLINYNAFKDCSGLESISFPASLVDGVSASVTEGCSGLREVINNRDKTCWLNKGDFTWVDKATGEPLQTTYDGSSAKLLNGTAVTDGGYCKPYADAAYELKYRISGEQISIIGCTGKRIQMVVGTLGRRGMR